MLGTPKFSVTFCTVLISICQGYLHPPTNLTYEWLDPMTVNVSWSWKKPRDLPLNCKIKHEISLNGKKMKIKETHYHAGLLTENAAKWNCSVRTERSCSGHIDTSSAAELVIEPQKPPVVLADFICLLSNSDMNCSWTSDRSSPVLLFQWRYCGETKTVLRKLRNCNLTPERGERTACSLRGDFFQSDVCMMATTAQGVQTFRPKRGLSLPHLNISKNGTNLSLTWAESIVDCLRYNICYPDCNKPTRCHETSEFLEIPFDESCTYRFQYRVQTTEPCAKIYSDWGNKSYVYGSSSQALKVVAYLIPLFVAACVVLSCICLRRHKNILCPEIPDPSAIFKEMMNDNRQIKPNISTYMPVQEPCERISIVPHIPQESGPVMT